MMPQKGRCVTATLPCWLLTRLPTLSAVPVIDVAADAVLLEAVTFLDLAFELVALAGDAVEVIVGELAPLFFDLAFDLLPVSFDAVPIHDCGLLVEHRKQRTLCREVPNRCGLRCNFMDQPPTSKPPEQDLTTALEIGILPRDADRHTLEARSPLWAAEFFGLSQ